MPLWGIASISNIEILQRYQNKILRAIVNSAWYIYDVCPESKDTKVLNMYNIFNLQKRHCEGIACT